MPAAHSGRIGVDALLQELERGLHRRAVGERELAQQEGIRALGVRDHRPVRRAVPPELVLRVEAAFLLGHLGPNEHPELVAFRVEVHELPAVRVADQEVAVVEPEGDDLVDQREQQRAVGAGADRHPLVGDRRVAGAHRIDRDEPPAVALELRDRDLQRVRVMVLGGADHHEQLRPVEVGAAELPERPADRVDHPGRHVDRAEPAVRRVVGRAELAREEPGQRLHLVAAGEERELLRVGRADAAEALFEHPERLVPAHLDELAGAAFGAGLAHERLREPGGRVLLHDPRAALGADHAVVQRMVGIAFDVADFAVAQVDAYAAAARAHVACGVPGLRHGARQRRSEGVVEGHRGHGVERAGPPAPGAAAPARGKAGMHETAQVSQRTCINAKQGRPCLLPRWGKGIPRLGRHRRVLPRAASARCTVLRARRTAGSPWPCSEGASREEPSDGAACGRPAGGTGVAMGRSRGRGDGRDCAGQRRSRRAARLPADLTLLGARDIGSDAGLDACRGGPDGGRGLGGRSPRDIRIRLASRCRPRRIHRADSPARRGRSRSGAAAARSRGSLAANARGPECAGATSASPRTSAAGHAGTSTVFRWRAGIHRSAS